MTRRAAVLVVDDEAGIRIALSRVLRAHDVTTVETAREAIALVASGARFDVILSDLMMPEVSGMDLYETLRLQAPDAADRMVFVTGGACAPDVRAFLDRVPNEVIEKPFDFATVRALVERYIA